MRREEQPVLLLEVNHRTIRRCHGCGSYSRPGGEIGGRLYCERCFERVRREDPKDLNEVLRSEATKDPGVVEPYRFSADDDQ